MRDKIVADIADLDLLDNLESRYALCPDGIPNVLLMRLTAVSFTLYILSTESLILGEAHSLWKNAYFIPTSIRVKVVQNLLNVTSFFVDF